MSFSWLQINFRFLRTLTSNAFMENIPNVHMHIHLESKCGFFGDSEDVLIE